MRAITETSGDTAITTVVSLSVRRDRATARERRTEYLARAYACGDMAARTLDAHDARFLRAMTIVWQVLAEKGAGAAAHRRLEQVGDSKE